MEQNLDVLREIATSVGRVTTDMHGSLSYLARAQDAVEIVSIFFVSVYAAQLIYMLAPEDHPYRGLYVAASAAIGAVVPGVMSRWKRFRWVAGLALAGFIIAAALLTTAMPAPSSPAAHRRDWTPWVVWSTVLGSIATITIWRASRPDPHTPKSASPPAERRPR